MRMRFWTIALLSFMCCTLAFKLFILLEIIPCFFFAVFSAMGAYAVHIGMDIQWLTYFGISCFFSGIMDFLQLIDAFVKFPFPWFDRRYPAIINLVQFVRVA